MMNSRNTVTSLRRHPSFVSSAAVGGLLLCFAVAISRPDLFVIALPVSLWAARAYTSNAHVSDSAESLIRCRLDALSPEQTDATGLITWRVPHTADAILVTIATERGERRTGPHSCPTNPLDRRTTAHQTQRHEPAPLGDRPWVYVRAVGYGPVVLAG